MINKAIINNLNNIEECIADINYYFFNKHNIKDSGIKSAYHHLTASNDDYTEYKKILGFHTVDDYFSTVKICGDLHCYSGDLFDVPKFKNATYEHLLERIFPYMLHYNIKTISIGYNNFFLLKDKKFINITEKYILTKR